MSKKEKVLYERELLSTDFEMSMRSGKKDTKMRIRAFPVSVNFFSNLKISYNMRSTLLQSTVVYVFVLFYMHETK